MFLDRFISVDSQKEYTYEELRAQFKINPPDNFNYAFDVIDAIAHGMDMLFSDGSTEHHHHHHS